MVLRKSGFGAALLGGVLALLHLSPAYVTTWLMSIDNISILWIETHVEAITFFQSVLGAGGFFVGFGGVFLVGYWAGGQVALRQQYRELLAAIGVGGVLGYLVPLVLLLLYAVLFGGGPFANQNLGVATVLLLSGRVIGVSIQFAVVGVAGGAVAEFATAPHRSDGPSSHHH